MIYEINCDPICVDKRIGIAKFNVRNGANPERRKQHDNADVTLWIVPTTDKNWQLVVTYQSQFVVNSDILL